MLVYHSTKSDGLEWCALRLPGDYFKVGGGLVGFM
jgi:hypothetical protein